MTATQWVSMGLLAAAFLAVLVIGEVVGRRRSLPPELTRRLDHVAAGPVALAVPLVLDSVVPVLVLAGSFVAVLVLTRRVGHLGSVHGIARRSIGAYLYPIAIAVTWFATQGNLGRYAVAILALALTDAAGGFVGERWGRRTYAAWGQAKTWEGSLATFGVAAVVSVPVLLVAGMPPSAACLAGVLVASVVALVEGSLPFGLDNLGVPLAALAVLATFGTPLAASLLLGTAAMFALALVLPSPSIRIGRRSATASVSTRTG